MYQNIAYHKKTNTIHLWDDELGYKQIDFKPYGYLPDANGQYKSLDGTKLKRVAANIKNDSDS